MPNYRRNFVLGGAYLFTVNLLERQPVASMKQGGIEDLQRSDILDSTAFHRGYWLITAYAFP